MIDIYITDYGTLRFLNFFDCDKSILEYKTLNYDGEITVNYKSNKHGNALNLVKFQQ